MSKQKKVIYFIHHLFAIHAGIITYLTHPFVSFVVAMLFQVEISTIFYNIRYFAMKIGNKYWFSISGIFMLVTFGMSRVIIMQYDIYLTYYMKDTLIFLIGVDTFYTFLFGTILIWILSVVEFCRMVVFDVSRVYILNVNKTPIRYQNLDENHLN
eukprot:159613_1